MSQVARGNYAPQAYHDFIGFQVEKEVLERAFRDTYAMELSDIFGDLDLALATYRHAVSAVIPELTRVAWHLKKDELAKAEPGVSKRKFVYNLSRASYRKEWSEKYPAARTGRANPLLLHPDSAQDRAAQSADIPAADAANGGAIRDQLRPHAG